LKIGIRKTGNMGRASILAAIRNNKPDLVALPNINASLFDDDTDVVETFMMNLQLVGGKVIPLQQLNEVDEAIKKQYPNAKHIVSCSGASQLGTITISKDTSPHTLHTIDLAIINATLGVAENGAVWLSETDFIVRALPFITNDLVIILSKHTICRHMHEAYNRISERDKSFGLFLSGPSKTADIEQCLVIGAQGAVSVTVFLTD
jgi:L-lactate dehydrogenase complex protein LldG